MKKLIPKGAMSCIYMIVNIAKAPFKYYIGSTINPKVKYNDHLLNLRRGTHFNKKLQNAFNKYDEKNFQFIVIKTVTKERMYLEEEKCIKYFDAVKKGYNIKSVAIGGQPGLLHSKETKQKMSLVKKGKPTWNKGLKGYTNKGSFTKGMKAINPIKKGQRISPKTEFKSGMKAVNPFKKGNVPWNKGKKGLQVAWNKGVKMNNLNENNIASV